MKTLTFSLLLMSASMSFANEAPDERMNHTPFESQLTRAQVVGDYLLARSQGTLPDFGEGGSPPSAAALADGPQLTRAEVVAEYVRARAEGTLVDTSETGSMHAPVFAGGPDRRELFAEGVVATAAVGESE